MVDFNKSPEPNLSRQVSIIDFVQNFGDIINVPETKLQNDYPSID